MAIKHTSHERTRPHHARTRMTLVLKCRASNVTPQGARACATDFAAHRESRIPIHDPLPMLLTYREPSNATV
jgi:hypothetical protein